MAADVSIKHFTWDEIHSHSNLLAFKILQRGYSHFSILAISRGGLVPATIISYKLNNNNLHAIKIQTRDNEYVNDEDFLFFKRKFNNGEKLVVIDEVLDTGKTFEIVKRYFNECIFCVLYLKNQKYESKVISVMNYSPDIWLKFPWEK